MKREKVSTALKMEGAQFFVIMEKPSLKKSLLKKKTSMPYVFFLLHSRSLLTKWQRKS